jgi:hypothetical protein
MKSTTQKEHKRMKVRKFLLMFSLTVVVGVPLIANAATAIATVGPNTSAPNVFFNGNCNGAFNLITNNAFIRSKVGFGFNPNVNVQFSPMVGLCGTYQINAQGIWHLGLRDPNGLPTTFVVTDNAGNPLLKGEFRGAILHGRSGSSSLALTLPLDNVVYDVAASPWLAPGIPPDSGSLSIAILALNPVMANNNGPQGFQANGDINVGMQ